MKLSNQIAFVNLETNFRNTAVGCDGALQSSSLGLLFLFNLQDFTLSGSSQKEPNQAGVKIYPSLSQLAQLFPADTHIAFDTFVHWQLLPW